MTGTTPAAVPDEPLSERESPREASPPLAADLDPPPADVKLQPSSGTDPRESLGRRVHEVRCAFSDAMDRPFALPPWEERHPSQRELDMQIGEAIAAAERERLAARMDELAANYPEDVFPRGGSSRDAIGGAAMRHAYWNAAREIREGRDA